MTMLPPLTLRRARREDGPSAVEHAALSVLMPVVRQGSIAVLGTNATNTFTGGGETAGS
jgi:hypothetical protein